MVYATIFQRCKGWNMSGDIVARLQPSNIAKLTAINPLTSKLFNCNFHPLEVVSRWRYSQLQVGENDSDFTEWSSTILKSCSLMSRLIFKMLKNKTNITVTDD